MTSFQSKQTMGTVCIVVGIGLAIYAIYPFVAPFFSGVGGLLLINYGLQLRGLPRLSLFLVSWMNRFR